MLPCSTMLRVLKQLIVCHWHYSLWVRPLKYDENQFIGAWSTPNYDSTWKRKFFSRFLQIRCQQRLRSRWALFICSVLCYVNLLARTVFESICFPFFLHKSTSISRQNWFARKSRVYKTVTKRPRFSDKNIASSVWKSTTDSKHLTINHVIFSYLQNHQHWDILVFSKVLSLKLGKTPSSRQQFYFALYSPSSAVNITS